MSSSIRNGVLAIVSAAAVIFVAHWTFRASHAAASPALTVTIESSGGSVLAKSSLERAPAITGKGEKYALEIRAVGLVINAQHQDTVWHKIQAQGDNFSSILSSDPKEYGRSPDERAIFSNVATGAAFRYAAGEAIHHWPVPVIISGPPISKTTPYKTVFEIASGQQNASLGLTEFLWVSDHNTNSSAPSLRELFAFFDKHPDVPSVLILSQDGMQIRWLADTPGMPKDPPGAFIPPVPDSMGGMLVTRSDRVDQFVRPYAVDVPGDIDKRKTQYDVVKLWNFYWKKDEQFQDERDAAVGGGYSGAYTMNTDWWISKLPDLWKEIENKGPGNFTPTEFLPVRWTKWQVKEFDEAPLLGYLHRPIEIKLTDDHGKQLKRTQQVAALQKGWKDAMARLPIDTKLSRVFYDTTLSRDWVIPITQALHDNAEGIDLGDVKEGYDIGRRIGNTGVSSALVQVCLATMASYEDGGASATINLMDNGTASIVMVSPPDDASKMNNKQHRGSDPFKYLSP